MLYRIRGWAAELDGELLGIGGITFPPGVLPIAFVHVTEQGRRHPVSLHRIGLAFMRELRTWGISRVAAAAQPDLPAAERWLIRLGFVATEIDGQKVFIWQALKR